MTDLQTVLIASGSIAATKTLDIVRQLQSQSIDVSLIITEAAKQWITSKVATPVVNGSTLTSDEIDQESLSTLLKKADNICIAPASANFIKRLTYQNDVLAQSIVNSQKTTMLVAPAMNFMMWQHPATQRNVKTLLKRGFKFLGPDHGDMACGDHGFGRMMEPENIAEAIINGASHSAFKQIEEALIAEPILPQFDAEHPKKKVLLVTRNSDDVTAITDLIRDLQSRNHEIVCATNEQIKDQLISESLECPIYTDHYQQDPEGMEHIRLAEQADAVLIPFATSAEVKNMIQGDAKDFLGCIYLATKKPVVLWPSQHKQHAPAPHDLEQLKKDGVMIINTASPDAHTIIQAIS